MTYAREWRTETDPGRALYLRVSCTYIVCGIHVKQTKFKHSQFSVACRQSQTTTTDHPHPSAGSASRPLRRRALAALASRSRLTLGLAPPPPARAPALCRLPHTCVRACDTRAHKKSTSVELPLRFSETVRRNMAFLKARLRGSRTHSSAMGAQQIPTYMYRTRMEHIISGVETQRCTFGGGRGGERARG